MRKYFVIVLSITLLSACSNSEIKINEAKLNEAGEKLQNTVEKGADTIGAKLERLKDKIDDDGSNH